MRTPKYYNELLSPLREAPSQVYFGKRVHMAGLISWVLEQTGPADVTVTTFSTSEDFLYSFRRLKEDAAIKSCTLLCDMKATAKTLPLLRLMSNTFDNVHFCENHSKLLLVDSGEMKVSVITSMNQTYGGRNESTLITTDPHIYLKFREGVDDIIHNKSVRYDKWRK